MTTFGTRLVNRKQAVKFARCGIGRILHINGHPFIGFVSRDLKRRKPPFDVVSLIGDQPTKEVCTMGQPMWFQMWRTWYPIEGGKIRHTYW